MYNNTNLDFLPKLRQHKEALTSFQRRDAYKRCCSRSVPPGVRDKDTAAVFSDWVKSHYSSWGHSYNINHRRSASSSARDGVVRDGPIKSGRRGGSQLKKMLRPPKFGMPTKFWGDPVGDTVAAVTSTVAGSEGPASLRACTAQVYVTPWKSPAIPPVSAAESISTVSDWGMPSS